MTEEEIKQCPYCAETIKKAAIICRFCRANLDTGMPAFDTQQAAAPMHEVKARSSISDGVKIGCGMFIVLPILIIFGILFFGAALTGVGSSTSSVESNSEEKTASPSESAATEKRIISRNKGWDWANSNKTITKEECSTLSNSDEKDGCEAYVMSLK